MSSKILYLIVLASFVFQLNSGFAQTIKRDLDKNIFINFIKVAREMSDIVQKKESTALTYEWTITPDSSTCFILERYASSEASLAHNKLFSEQFAKKFGEVLEFVGLTVYGNPSEELKNAFGDAGLAHKVKVVRFAR